ncbi:cytochrome P450 121 [Longimycelium tulufanense]|uniref:Cytochrome P450 121 n=1 Tax=Longimycelium tulufanense TaxID=907463 RepID=A0A8J3FWL9_9PSEU|nr:cytochrome P450 [Longimycelium tulufanense]GGM60879.1 cytochrome P450 121 [Longimycelium tulufanense]
MSADVLDFPFSARGDRLPDEVTMLRDTTPVRKVRTIAGDEAWLVSSHALCNKVLHDSRFSLKETSTPGVPRQYALTIPPEVVNNMGNITHAGLRKAVMKALNPKAPGLEEFMRTTAETLVRSVTAEGAPADLRNDFAEPYSAALHCHILGIPQQDAPKLMRSLHIAFMNSAEPIPAAKLNWDRDITYMTKRLDDPTTTGLMADLAALRGDLDYVHLTDDMLATVGVTLFGAGVISTSGFLTMALVSLIQHKDLRDRLVDDRDLIPDGVEELLRINLSIGDALPRIATDDIRLGDVLVKRGELVLVSVEGANFDPNVFAEPEKVDLHRPNNSSHFSFGGGKHYCPASALGRKHAEIALDVLLKYMPGLDIAVPMDQLVWRTRFMKRTPERLPVLW